MKPGAHMYNMHDTTVFFAVFYILQLSIKQQEVWINGAKCKIITDEMIDEIKVGGNNVEKVQELRFLSQ